MCTQTSLDTPKKALQTSLGTPKKTLQTSLSTPKITTQTKTQPYLLNFEYRLAHEDANRKVAKAHLCNRPSVAAPTALATSSNRAHRRLLLPVIAFLPQ